MRKIFFIFAVALSSCANPVLVRDPPNIVYELGKYDDLLVTNSPMYAEYLFKSNQRSSNREIHFRLFVKNSNIKKSVNVDLKSASFSFLNHTLPASCILENSESRIDPDQSRFIDCNIILSGDDVARIGSSDLIGELKIPVASEKPRNLISKIYLRNETLK